MQNSDRKLGMDRSITRRDVIHGIGAIGAGFAIPGSLLGCAKRPAGESIYYPPALTGLRGNHDGAFEVAHALAREGRTDWGPVQTPDSPVYDLVIVGAGLSGLQQHTSTARKDRMRAFSYLITTTTSVVTQNVMNSRSTASI